MFYKSLLRKAVALQFTGHSFRSASTFASAMTSPQNFGLDRALFNDSLYSDIRDTWFKGLPEDAVGPNQEVEQRWWNFGLSQKEKDAFDQKCRENYGPALKSVDPHHIALPTFESCESDIANAENIAAPFLTEVKEAQAKDTKHGAATLLSLILLLDQMTRNIHRDPAGLKLVYNHYDRLALSLLYSSMRLQPNPIEHDAFRLRPAYNSWFIIPLMHSEHLPSHDLWRQITNTRLEECTAVHGQDAAQHFEGGLKAAVSHYEPLEKFDRYPHRNEALGRESTEEEKEYLKTADTFGVDVSPPESDSGEGQKKVWDKSEL